MALDGEEYHIAGCQEPFGLSVEIIEPPQSIGSHAKSTSELNRFYLTSTRAKCRHGLEYLGMVVTADPTP